MKSLEKTYGFTNTSFGEVLIVKTEQGIRWLSFVLNKKGRDQAVMEMSARIPHDNLDRDDRVAQNVWQNKDTFALDLRGTSFQMQVWEALLTVPYGQTVSYSALANSIGKPSAARAVGNAVGRNPVSILVPCHRVIRGDGGIGGYAWGVERKRDILRAEGVEL